MRSPALLLALTLAILVAGRTADARPQARSWIQIEARPSLDEARERARHWARELADVHGFALGGGWYGILLGPYEHAQARATLRRLRGSGAVPADSFVNHRPILGPRFFPAERDSGAAGPQQPRDTTDPAPAVAAPATPAAPDETPARARHSERRLDRDERKAIQIALAAAGFYDAAIDGAFGRGTRTAMAAWQRARGHAPTGILTTRQRRQLMEEYDAPLRAVGMRRVRDPQAGIEMPMPAALVSFAHYEPPFAHYAPSTAMGVRLILISQPGSRATLFALYDILQTLEIVPPEGPRESDPDGFTIEGHDGRIVTHAEAALKNGKIKGFILVWPAGDDERRRRVLAEMKAGFTRTKGVLDPAAAGAGEPRIDLLSGLKQRAPRLSRSGFFTDDGGTVVTTTEAVQGCTRITLDRTHRARVLARDDRLGVAVLTPEQPLAPPAVAKLRAATQRLRTQVVVSGFSWEGLLGAPTLTFGRLADMRGLDGDDRFDRLTIETLPGDAGGPVLDRAGLVVGMLLPDTGPRSGGARKLPRDVRFSVDARVLRAILTAAGREIGKIPRAAALPPDDLDRVAAGMTVLVSCWD